MLVLEWGRPWGHSWGLENINLPFRKARTNPKEPELSPICTDVDTRVYEQPAFQDGRECVAMNFLLRSSRLFWRDTFYVVVKLRGIKLYRLEISRSFITVVLLYVWFRQLYYRTTLFDVERQTVQCIYRCLSEEFYTLYGCIRGSSVAACYWDVSMLARGITAIDSGTCLV